MADEEAIKVLQNVEEGSDLPEIVVTCAIQQSDTLDTETKFTNKMDLEDGVTDQNECNSIPIASLENLPQSAVAEMRTHSSGYENGKLTCEIKCGVPSFDVGSENDKENCHLSAISGQRLEEASADENSESQNKMEYLTNSNPPLLDLACHNIATNSTEHLVPRTSDVTDNEEVLRRAREEGQVVVVFPGAVTQDSCCKFVCEIVKCILYLRQQLPMTFDQLMYYQKQQTASQPNECVVRFCWLLFDGNALFLQTLKAEYTVGRRPSVSGGWDWRKCQRTLQEVEEVLKHLENLFSLSRIPRVLLLLGGSIMLPKELYEVNMEALAAGAFQQSLLTAPCLRQLFRTLFRADILSDARPVRLMATTVMALGHRDCGVAWFRPRLDYRVPSHVKRQVISLSSDPALSEPPLFTTVDLEDYVWFQAPVTIKGFCK